jgi:hypothetical protein
VTFVRSAAAKASVLPITRPERKAKSRPREREALYTYACLPAEIPACWLAQFAPDTPCDGRMQKAHLIRAQVIRREVSRDRAVVWCEAVWRPACYRHHTLLDQSRTLTIPRAAIPAETERWAAEHGLDWWLDREYGEREAVA